MAPALLRWCTVETYAFLADLWAFNEYLFTGIVQADRDGRQRDALRDYIAVYAEGTDNERYPDFDALMGLASEMRERIVPEFVDYAVSRVLAASPKVVGLTCLFDQTMASVALAKRLKAVAPSLPIVLGGYALEGAPGVTVGKAFPWIDLIVMGDGEQAIVDVTRDVLEGREVTARAKAGRKVVRAAPVNLEKSPLPDYDDWFVDLELLAVDARVKVRTKALPVESSRGCWWGQHQHCVFCGIDDETLTYRHKSPARTHEMLAEMRDRYGDHIFRFSDYIMPKAYYTTLLPALAQEQQKYRLHTELKANHPPERVRLLSEAGFREIQPGIESFSTQVLKDMHKGVTSIENVSLLKAGYLCRVMVHYNILFGLPGDRVGEYLEMLRRVPQLYHLMPPVTCTDTAITRYAPLQTDPARFGLGSRQVHHHWYDMLFSKDFLTRSGFSLDAYGYFFERGFEYGVELEVLYRQLCQQVDHWKALHRERFVQLSFQVVDGRLAITDTRFQEEERYTLSALASTIYLECDGRPISRRRVRSELERCGRCVSEGALDRGVDELVSRRVVWTEGEKIVGLAVPDAVASERRNSGWCATWLSLWQ